MPTVVETPKCAQTGAWTQTLLEGGLFSSRICSMSHLYVDALGPRFSSSTITTYQYPADGNKHKKQQCGEDTTNGDQYFFLDLIAIHVTRLRTTGIGV